MLKVSRELGFGKMNMTGQGVGVDAETIVRRPSGQPATGIRQEWRCRSGASVLSHWRLVKSASVFTVMIGEPSVLRTQMAPYLVQTYLNPARAATALVRRNKP